MSHRILRIEESKQYKTRHVRPGTINDNRFYALAEEVKHLENENRSLVIKLDYARREIENTKRKWQIVLMLCISCFACYLCFGSTMTDSLVSSDPTSDLGSAY